MTRPSNGDAALFAAEARCGELRDQMAAMSESKARDLLDDAHIAAERVIFATPPQTLAGAAVKLRLLVHLDRGIEGTEEEMAALRQVLALAETSATAVPVTGPTGVPPATARLGDSVILGLFREWIETERLAQKLAGRVESEDGPEQAEFEAASDRCVDLELAVGNIPSEGMTGFAIKAYLRHHVAHSGGAGDPAAIHAPPGYDDEKPDRYPDSWLSTSMIADAARFVPELAPLCAEALAAVAEQGDPSS